EDWSPRFPEPKLATPLTWAFRAQKIFPNLLSHPPPLRPLTPIDAENDGDNERSYMAKLSTIKRGDTRYYVNAEGEKDPGVTSISSQLPQPFLTGRAAKVVAEWCADNAGAFLQLLINGERDAALQLAKGAPRRSTSDAANVGSAVHDYFELYARGNAPKRAPLDVQPFVRHIQEFHDKYQPEYLFLEDAVWSHTHDYAGSFDWIARINGEVVLGDTKTTRSGV